MNTLKMSFIVIAVLALAGCIIAPAPGPAYYSDGPRYEAAPIYDGVYVGGFDDHRDGGRGNGRRERSENHWR